MPGAELISARLGRFVRRAQRRFVRLDAAAILAVLRSFAPSGPEILMVHSSLSACGRIRGGARAVVESLEEWSGRGTLVMPVHTYCYSESGGEGPVFDRSETPSVSGAITEYFRKMPDTVRSLHPTHSIAARGPLAGFFCENHERCTTPCGAGTPYERLVQRDAAVLMFGVSMNVYTLFHTTEDAAGVPYLYFREPAQLRYRDDAAGCVRKLAMKRQDMTVPRSFPILDKWLEERGLLLRRKLGMGELLLVSHARAAHEAFLKELAQNPYFLASPAGRT